MKKFTEKSTLKEILKSKNGDEILAKNGVPCVSCPMAKFEIERLKIGQVCEIYGLNIKKIIEELNSQK